MNKNRCMLSAFRNSRFLITSVMFCSFIVFIITGCATRQQVEEIVKKSNETVLHSLIDMSMSLLPGAGLPSAGAEGSSSGNWEEESARIDAFIASHSDQDSLASALRVRQAMLLLTYGQYELARASFNLVRPEHLFTDRDRALYELKEHLVWWFEQDKTIFEPADFNRGAAALAEFKKTLDTLRYSPEIRDYLAEMRIYIALQMALRITSEIEMAKFFADGVNEYAKIFANGELQQLQYVIRGEKKPLNRRQVRALAVIEKAKEISMGQPGFLTEVQDPDFRALLNAVN